MSCISIGIEEPGREGEGEGHKSSKHNLSLSREAMQKKIEISARRQGVAKKMQFFS